MNECQCAFCQFYFQLSREHKAEARDERLYREHLMIHHGWKPEIVAIRN